MLYYIIQFFFHIFSFIYALRFLVELIDVLITLSLESKFGYAYLEIIGNFTLVVDLLVWVEMLLKILLDNTRKHGSNCGGGSCFFLG